MATSSLLTWRLENTQTPNPKSRGFWPSAQSYFPGSGTKWLSGSPEFRADFGRVRVSGVRPPCIWGVGVTFGCFLPQVLFEVGPPVPRKPRELIQPSKCLVDIHRALSTKACPFGYAFEKSTQTVEDGKTPVWIVFEGKHKTYRPMWTHLFDFVGFLLSCFLTSGERGSSPSLRHTNMHRMSFIRLDSVRTSLVSDSVSCFYERRARVWIVFFFFIVAAWDWFMVLPYRLVVETLGSCSRGKT